jgi:hypothetical protein
MDSASATNSSKPKPKTVEEMTYEEWREMRKAEDTHPTYCDLCGSYMPKMTFNHVTSASCPNSGDAIHQEAAVRLWEERHGFGISDEL